MKIHYRLLLILLVFQSCIHNENPEVYPVVDNKRATPIYIGTESDSLIRWAVESFAMDVENISGVKPEIISSDNFDGDGIYVGQVGEGFLRESTVFPDSLNGAWETFSIHRKEKNLIVAGSDVRGTVYGIFDLAERMGISPWQWWADVPISKKETLFFEIPREGIIDAPSVQYRGIFLNDEDWGLQPWAANNFEPELGDIGPKTYEKIFQLLLRLKANTIWPAMHPCTQGFFTVEGNMEMAQKYHVIIGSSHAEPMLRNNVSEWDHERYGDYNYFDNPDQINAYWQQRLNEVAKTKNETIMTLGMRGIHDSGMEGAKTQDEAIAISEKIIAQQRLMLAHTFQEPIEQIPQTFILYKEVLELYDGGLKVPDDATLMWTDDNYGYIRRLSNEEEQKRAGNSGVYYHLSYWGRPHDYLWLSSTQPALMWYEMKRAYANGAKKIWIANVGDIKPAEYNTEFFLDLAWDINVVDNNSINGHLKQWASREFGNGIAELLSYIMNENYRLAFLRKPEYMGWSQTEPTTPIKISEFTAEGANRRIAAYKELVGNVDSLASGIAAQYSSAWFQLVEYPIKAAANMNYKFLYYQLAMTSDEPELKKQYQTLGSKAYHRIKELTDHYNQMSQGKWNHMMSMAPRNLPVFDSIIYDIPIEEVLRTKTENPHRINIQAKEFLENKGFENYEWKIIDGLGYGNGALTLFPLKNKKFLTEKPWVSYRFTTDEPGEYLLEIRFLPTHSNNFDHEVTVELDGVDKGSHRLNTNGRSEEWKENVLRNSKLLKIPFTSNKAGNHSLRIQVNQSGIVIDQLAIYLADDDTSYEIPVPNTTERK